MWFSVQNGGCTVMSWAQLLRWSVPFSFASWASILFGKTIIIYICKMLPSSNYMQWWKDSTQQKDYSKFSAREPKHWNLWLTAVSVVSVTHSNILWAFPFTSNAWCRLCCNQSQSGDQQPRKSSFRVPTYSESRLSDMDPDASATAPKRSICSVIIRSQLAAHATNPAS